MSVQTRNTAKQAIRKHCMECGQYRDNNCSTQKCTFAPYAPKIKFPTQLEISLKINMHQAHISKILSGKIEPTKGFAQRISTLINKPWYEIMGMTPFEIKLAIREAIQQDG